LALQEPELSSLHLALTLVEGRILPSGRAKGFIFSANDPYDPVDTNDPAGDHNSSDECWTDGKVRWQAKPIRRSKPGAAPVPEPPAASEQANASGDRRGSYVGSLGSGREPVKLEIAGRGRRARAMFEGVLVVNCDQGAEGSLTPIGPIEVPLRKDGRFRYARFTQDPLTLDRTFTRVAGRVRATDRASGYVSSFFDPWDPFGEPNQRECTRLRAGWQAERRN